MKKAGAWFLVIAGLLTIWWFDFDPTAPGPLDESYSPTRVVNLQRLHLQTGLLMAALAFGVSSVACFVGAALGERLDRALSQISQEVGGEASSNKPRVVSEADKVTYWLVGLIVAVSAGLIYSLR